MQYTHFDNYILRAPALPLSFYIALTKGSVLQEKDLKEACENKIIREALFLASPPLYEAFEKWMNNNLSSQNAKTRMVNSILKYLSRMSSRCTPFGLFAGTRVGDFGDKTDFKISTTLANRHTRLDMNYLVALSQDLVKQKNIKTQLQFYPNTSIYGVGHQLRYVEYHYENGRRIHHIVGVSNSEYLQKVLRSAKTGASLETLSNCLIDDDISKDMASDFIQELVDSQLLVSELEPSVSGPEFLDQIIPILKKTTDNKKIVNTLENVNTAIARLDEQKNNKAQDYIAINKQLKELKTDFDVKFLFQTDLTIAARTNVLDKRVLYKVRRALRLLNKISPPPKDTLLLQFKDAFQERYEDREIPLSQALDVELGIGFLQNHDAGDVSELIDDLILPEKKDSVTTFDQKWTSIDIILHQKLLQSLDAKEQEIILLDKDFEHLKENWHDLPDTIATLAEVVTLNNEEYVVMSAAGGSSAANLSGRFCHSDVIISNHVNDIIKVEKQCNPDKLMAEIVHLPESRIGNILMRPILRDYEIPYLAKSILPSENQLPIEDLLLSIKAGRLILRSKKYNKEVLPRLTNAHNYSSNALPIYQFLANMQNQGKRSGINFNWGPYADRFSFLPRVIYKGVILSPKMWNFNELDIKELQEFKIDNPQFQKTIDYVINKKKLPQFVLLQEGDNELLINLKNRTSVQMLLSTIKGEKNFKLKEFLHITPENTKVANNYFTNQIVLSFYNQDLLKQCSNA